MGKQRGKRKASKRPTTQHEQVSSPVPNQAQGRVITRYGSEVIIETDTGEQVRATTRRKLEHVACGDYVEWQPEEQGNASVTAILPRNNVLSRPDFRGKLKNIAANIDVLVVVSSWRPAPQFEMLDRYLIAAHRLPCAILIVMNKSDLQAELATPEQTTCLQEYRDIGYDVVHVQARTPDSENVGDKAGIQALLPHLAGKTAAFVGQSGVGKSSIIAQLMPEQDIRIGTIGDTGEGRHTTTAAHLYHVPEQLVAGASLIDSPGVRDFSLPPLEASDLQQGYPEFTAFAGQCRFNNCTHQHEPGCVIKAQAEQGTIPKYRYQRYLAMLKTASDGRKQ